MIDLDQPAQFADVDRAGMLGRLLALPEQVRSAWSLVQSINAPSAYATCSSIVVCGMGGSAIGADLTRMLIEGECRVPISVIRGYQLPRYVGSSTLVLVSSFSGATEESLAACDAALSLGAKVMGLTTGGRLAELARIADFPLVRFSFPGQPREAIGYSFLLTVGALGRLGYIRDRTTEAEACASLLERMAGELGPEVGADANPAKRLAQHLYGKLAVVYGGGLMAEVARRWKCQLNENAKHWAFFEQLPELNHNAVLGYQFPTQLASQTQVIVLSSSLNHARISLRERVTEELLGRWGIQSHRVEARGDSLLDHLLSASYYGDLVSFYLAMINEVDPSDIDTITVLKSRLAEMAH